MQRALVHSNNVPLKLIPLALILVLVFSIIGPGVAQADPGWYDSDWDYRKKITINSANVTANLTNFPVLISLGSDSDLANDALENGYDILFTAGDEVTKLQHEIESFNGTSENLTAWVMIPSLSASIDTDIYMYYGNTGSGNSENATGVWDSNFEAVWHLNKESGSVLDSTANNNDGTNNGATRGQTGTIDGAFSFDGTNDLVDCGDVNTVDSASVLTYEAWAKPLTGVAGPIISKFTDATHRTHIWIQDTTIFWNVSNTDSSYGTSPVTLDTWHHFAMVFDGSQSDNTTRLKCYLDGEAQTLSFTGTIPATTADHTENLTLGKQSASSYEGYIDEARVSSTARSADWITTSYNNQNNPSDFFTLGSEETEIVIPTVTTNAASLVEETTATINGTLTSDGGAACQYSFEWGTTSGVYTDNISWTGSITTDQLFSTALSGLNKGDVYYFRARAKNSAGIRNGSEMSFLTKPDAPTSFSAMTASSSQINLSWTKGEGANRTMVRGKEGSYPTSVTDGDEVYFDTGTNASDTSLNPSTTYYYSAWSEVTGSQQWSDDYASANAATTSGAPTVVGGLVLPVNKATVLAPWLFLGLILSLVITRIILHFKKRRSSSYS